MASLRVVVAGGGAAGFFGAIACAESLPDVEGASGPHVAGAGDAAAAAELAGALQNLRAAEWIDRLTGVR